jgi:hypothetical protein
MDTTLSLRLGVGAPEDRLAFLALPARRAAEQVTGTANDAFNAIQGILSQILADVSGKRTAAEFLAARDMYLPQYMTVMMALNGIVSAVVPKDVIDRLSYESMSEMEADFQADGRAAFGSDIRDQALFTIWTLRKIHDLASHIDASSLPGGADPCQADPQLAKKFVNHILYSRFHLDCLKMSLRSERIIYPDLLEPISEGLRALVNAYAYIRQASDLRSDAAKEELIQIDFDEEEQELLALSMKDIAGRCLA